MINPYAATFMIAARTKHLVRSHVTEKEANGLRGRRRWKAPNHWREHDGNF